MDGNVDYEVLPLCICPLLMLLCLSGACLGTEIDRASLSIFWVVLVTYTVVWYVFNLLGSGPRLVYTISCLQASISGQVYTTCYLTSRAEDGSLCSVLCDGNIYLKLFAMTTLV